jgi:pimeloyl-ACP methyl ester carboxylesterase
LTTPEGKGPFTAVVLISGSGPQDRDESLMGHRPFAVLADHLTRKGIAVLRLDDRGIGKSTGRFAAATSADFASDTEAAVTYLEARPEIDRRKIGLVGHSEGGLIAAMIAARNAHVAFVVMMAGTGVRGDELLIAQAGAVLEGMGASAEAVQQAIAKQRELVTAIRTEPDDAAALAKLRDIVGPAVPQAQLSAQFQQLRSPWFKFFLDYDPAISLRNVHVPVLAINGEKDRQVPPAQNLPPIRQALAAAGNKNVEVLELPGLNHLFQTAKTGAPIEYAEIEETISPTALDTISRWILQR